MAKTYATMKANVRNNVQNAASAAIIGVFLNDRYRDIERRCAWSALIDDNKTFTATIDQAEYSISSDLSITDFEEELFVANVTQGYELERYTEGKWWKERNSAYQDGSITSGTPTRYVIIREAGKIKLDPPPNVADTYAIPYKKFVTDLSADADTTSILDIEWIMELGATGDAWAYDRQFPKADWFLQRYELELRRRIGQERSAVNQKYQRISEAYRVAGIRRLTGNVSYDSL